MFQSPSFEFLGSGEFRGEFQHWTKRVKASSRGKGGGALPYRGHIGMCRCEGYVFQAVYSSIGYINQSVWV